MRPSPTRPAWGPTNDAIAPEPCFSVAQDERLALLYVVAGRRARSWMVPGFHAAIDEGISDAHDDPQNFDLTTFALAVLYTLTYQTNSGSFGGGRNEDVVVNQPQFLLTNTF